jgi:Zn-dependent peptidase ImmA (M78 family)
LTTGSEITAARRALSARLRFGYALDSPCDVYELIHKYGVGLRFINTSTMDGLYINDGFTGSINVTALRPAGHQRFTAAHELGHFVLGHGARLDQKIEEMTSDSQDERLADTFARHLLMPKRAVIKGFANFGQTAAIATPDQYFAVAAWLGVGYTTLIQHSRWTLGLITTARLHALTLKRPQQLKRSLIPTESWTGRRELWPISPHWDGSNIHLQIGDVVTGLVASDIDYFIPCNGYSIASAVGRLSAPIIGGGRVFLNISRTDYVGLYDYRYLEEPADA